MTSLAQIVPYIGLTDQFAGISKLSGGVLPLQRTITVSTAAVPGATSLQLLSSAAGTILRPNTVFSVLTTATGQNFTSRRVAVQIDSAVDVTIGTTAAPVAIKPLKYAIAATSVGQFWVGTEPILGLSEFGFEPSSTTEDVSGTDSIGMITAKLRTGAKASITLHERPGDRGTEFVKVAVESTDETLANAWVVMIRGDGEMRAGVALFADGSAPGGASTNARQSFSLSFQGNNYQRYPAYIFA
jgi:hypothetical protein